MIGLKGPVNLAHEAGYGAGLGISPSLLEAGDFSGPFFRVGFTEDFRGLLHHGSSPERVARVSFEAMYAMEYTLLNANMSPDAQHRTLQPLVPVKTDQPKAGPCQAAAFEVA